MTSENVQGSVAAFHRGVVRPYFISFNGKPETVKPIDLVSAKVALRGAINCRRGEHPGRGLEFTEVSDGCLIMFCRSNSLRITAIDEAEMGPIYNYLITLLDDVPPEDWVDQTTRLEWVGRIQIRASLRRML